jgi:hypothetical protein
MQLRCSEKPVSGKWASCRQQIAEKLDFEFDFGWRSGSPLRIGERFTLALAAEVETPRG